MKKQLDTMHFSFREIDGYNKPFNFVISAREAGKSTAFINKAYKIFLDGGTSLILRRQKNHISEAYIYSLQTIINNFWDESVIITYKKGALKEGIVYLYINEKLFACVVALACQNSEFKSLVLKNVKAIFVDEFIVDPQENEKYIHNEATKFKEIYNTFYRETEKQLKCYFMGNPYSHYNPYFLWLNVDTTKLKEGALITGGNWIIQCYKLSEELKQYILSRNPLYEFDDSYTRYGFNGDAIRDENIRLSDLPKNYSLQYIFKSEGKFIGVYKNNYIDNMEDRFFCKFIDYFGNNRTAYCFDFSELINRCALISRDDRFKFQRFKKSLQQNKVVFDSIAVYYLVIEIYNFI